MQSFDGALWARGANWKMSFERGTATFFPFLSSAAPRTEGIAFALRDVRIDEQPLSFDTLAPADGDSQRIEFDRGALVERYELAPRLVEQSFHFAALPERGELVLSLDVTSELAPRSADDGWRFESEWGHALYGHALALDAAGRKLPLVTTLEDGVLSLRVPSSFVREAVLPLVIDPVLASFGIEGTPTDALAPDVSYDATGGAVLHCWEEIFSAADHDVWADAYDPAGNPLYRGDWIDATAAYWGHPRSASVGSNDRFLVVAHVVNATTGRVEVWGRLRSRNTPLLAAPFKITGASGYDALYPDVGGDPYPTGPSHFLVTYERVWSFGADHDVHARLVSEAGALASAPIQVDGTIHTLDTAISISKSNCGDAWNLAWQRRSPVGGNDILGARVAWDGVVIAPTFPIAVGPLDHTSPSASSCAQGSSRWLCVYEEDFGTDHDIVASGLDGASVRRSANLSVYDGNFMGQDQRSPCVDSDGTHFALAYSELYGSSTVDYDVYVSEVLFNGPSLAVLAAHQPVFQTNGAEFEPALAARESSQQSQTTHDYALAWHRAPNGLQLASHDIVGAAYRGASGGLVASYCDGATVTCPCGNGTSTVGGCPNSVTSAGARLTWSGEPSTTQDTLQLFVAGMPGGTTALFFQGTAMNGALGSVTGDGVRCVSAPATRLAMRTASVTGGALFPGVGDASISVTGSVPTTGTTLVYQVWYRNSAPHCGPSTTNLSNALVIAWTP
ncbi:MAG: hypothetical protein FJ294_03130 [Planctomycetes bacterium]|nr:hypothetical protein [Planctomycetota bacterium]